jgi:hypothetical protein
VQIRFHHFQYRRQGTTRQGGDDHLVRARRHASASANSPLPAATEPRCAAHSPKRNTCGSMRLRRSSGFPVMRYTTLVAVIVGTPRTALRVTPRRGA